MEGRIWGLAGNAGDGFCFWWLREAGGLTIFYKGVWQHDLRTVKVCSQYWNGYDYFLETNMLGDSSYVPIMKMRIEIQKFKE